MTQEVNSAFSSDLDTEPNLPRSAKRPAMYSAFRNSPAEAALFIGGSHAVRLASAAGTLGLDAFKIASGGWKPSKDKVDVTLRDFTEMLEYLPDGAPIVIFGLDNTAFLCVGDDGSMKPISKCVEGDSGYHVLGELAVAPERSINPGLDQLGRIVDICTGHPVYIISPIPRYISMPCCDDTEHVTNFSQADFFSTLFRDLTRLRYLVKTKLPKAIIVDGLELVCGKGYTRERAEELSRQGWSSEPVHPTAHTYAKMALNLIEAISPGGEEDHVPDNFNRVNQLSGGRKRKLSDSSGGSVSSGSSAGSGSLRARERSSSWRSGGDSGRGGFTEYNNPYGNRDSGFSGWNRSHGSRTRGGGRRPRGRF